MVGRRCHVLLSVLVASSLLCILGYLCSLICATVVDAVCCHDGCGRILKLQNGGSIDDDGRTHNAY
eukprot:11140701-Prorocentrum_lima.AAC.1